MKGLPKMLLRLNTDAILTIIQYLLDKLSLEISDLGKKIEKHNEDVAIAQAKAADADSAKVRAEKLRAKLGKLFD